MKQLSEKLNRPIRIADKTVLKRIFLAPMAGLGNVAYRELVAGYGGYGLLFMEMCSAKSLPHENRELSPVFRWRDEELGSLVCQIFGSDPDTMAVAARRIEREGFFGVDMNFGCSVSGICRQNCGAALLKTPDLAVRIAQAVRRAVSIPVFAKFRTGWEDDPGGAVDLARRFEDSGVDALVFHPRVSPDRRSRPPKWEYIARVKESVSIPVFGNGNVFDAEDCLRMIDTTGCDGVAIGRLAIAKPWIFSQWTGGFMPEPSTYCMAAMKMCELVEKHYEGIYALRLFRKFALYYAANFQFGHEIYKKISSSDDFDAIKRNIIEIFENNPAVTKRPNLAMFT